MQNEEKQTVSAIPSEGTSHDPRVYFAAERTLLAWHRTGLAVMGIGFLVARFGLFLRLIRHGEHAAPAWNSTLIGVGFVALGTIAVALAGWQHARFSRHLPEVDLPRGYSRWPSALLTCVLVVLGAILGAYLSWGTVVNSDSPGTDVSAPV